MHSSTASGSTPGRADSSGTTPSFDELPDGAFVLEEGKPHLVLGADLLTWTPSGYASRSPRPAHRQALLITPRSLVAVLRTGWQPLVPLLHPSAVDI